jgi:hypothetical protein
MPIRLLSGVRAAAEVPEPGADGSESYGVSELRSLRAGRHRWD